MCIYYLYVKTHKITGLKYLGYTGKNDPHEYTGSGKYWLRHLKIHGKTFDTEILVKTTDKSTIRESGIYYSNLWNVVESKDWANLKPESGDGAGIGNNNPMSNPIIRAKQQAIIMLPDVKKLQRTKTKEAMNREEVKAKLKIARNKPEYKDRARQQLNSPEIIANRKGSGNARYDHTIYTFIHSSGLTEQCSRFELQHKYDLDQGNLSKLINGKNMIIKGWKLKK
jgi:hypothetical protein